jgi:magnesium chelatase family protein
VHVARAKKTLIFPARFILAAAMNPCPCGNYESGEKECTCTAHEVLRYQKKISGPLLDRFDLQIDVKKIPLEELRAPRKEMPDDSYRDDIAYARQVQQERFADTRPRIHTNAEMSSRQTEKYSLSNKEAEEFLKKILETKKLSTRGYYRILKVARTIADLARKEEVTKEHLSEAFQYRLRD